MTRFFWLGFALIASVALATNDPVSAKPNGGNTSVHHRGSDRTGDFRSVHIRIADIVRHRHPAICL